MKFGYNKKLYILFNPAVNVKHGYEYSSNFEGNMLFDDLASEAKIYQKGGLSYYDENHGINLSNLYFSLCMWMDKGSNDISITFNFPDITIFTIRSSFIFLCE